ncbi:MAG: hypothetical protein H0X33_14085 [Taibaiella sp.]|nr:hypothetical protein [Taibaiella sp.]
MAGLIQAKLDKLKDREYLLRPVAFGVLDLMTKRIHHEGKASDGQQIGQYSTGYLAERQKYNRGSDPTVIISFTRQLENDYSVVATDKGYGIGFLNKHNFDKSQWVQGRYKKKIFELTGIEKKYALDYINDLVNSVINA